MINKIKVIKSKNQYQIKLIKYNICNSEGIIKNYNNLNDIIKKLNYPYWTI